MATTYHWDIDQGSRADLELRLVHPDQTPKNTAGMLGRGEIRPFPGSPRLLGALLVTPIDTTTGRWRVTCLPATLADQQLGARCDATDTIVCAYDVELYDPNDPTNVLRVLQGEARISPEVTRT